MFGATFRSGIHLGLWLHYGAAHACNMALEWLTVKGKKFGVGSVVFRTLAFTDLYIRLADQRPTTTPRSLSTLSAMTWSQFYGSAYADCIKIVFSLELSGKHSCVVL